ncbi:MAG: cell wall-binding repeat-containing protein [Gracilibacteraceae bacterium]|jgi:putative cell wall-binding protein|nr:cell wall-binding repeat-containing protein [Gracilibacteraceae bacterium]
MSKKTISLLLLAALLCTLLPVQVFAADADSSRLAGSDRIATALEICDAGWSSANTVVLAAADQANLVDSLAAASLAGQESAPILLTFKNSLASNVRTKIQNLGATKVYVIGAISDSVVAQLREISGLSVEKLAGRDRWATSDAINAKLTGTQGTFVIGYNAIPDALSVGSFAAENHYQIVLADAQGNVSSAKLIGTVYIVGGQGVVKDISGATRFGGADRYATNALVISGLGYKFDRSYVANGVSMVDALSASPLAAKYGAPIFLANGASVPALNNSNVKGKLTAATKVIALGGTSAVSQVAVNAFGSAGTGGGTTPGASVNLSTIQSVEAVDASFDTRKDNQYLQLKVNNAVVTIQQLESAGYDVELSASESVFGGTSLSSDGKLNQQSLQDLYDTGAREFYYDANIYLRSVLVGQSGSSTITLIDGRYTASGGIASYQFNMIENQEGNLNEVLNMTSNKMVLGETFEIVNVKAATSSSGANTDVTSTLELASSNSWVVDVETSGNSKLLHAVGEGTSTITMRSGTSSKTVTITVLGNNDDGRVLSRATPDVSVVKVTNGGSDFLTLTLKDQYGDPYAGDGAYIGSRDTNFGGTYRDSDDYFLVSFEDSDTITTEGKSTLRVDGTARGKRDVLIYGERYYGGGTYKEVGRFAVDVSSSTSSASSYKAVASSSDFRNFTLDRNKFEEKSEMDFYIMGYSSSGYSLGPATINGTPTISGNSNLIEAIDTTDGMTVRLVDTDTNGEVTLKTGKPTINVKVDAGTSGQTKTVSVPITVVNTAPSVTRASFRSITSIDSGNVDLSEIISFSNVYTSGLLGDGVLNARAAGTEYQLVELYYTDGSIEQVVGYIKTNRKGVTFNGNGESASDISIYTGDDAGATVQFALTNPNAGTTVASLSVRINR